MAQRLFVNDRQVWLKHYGNKSRRLTLGLLDRLARSLSIEALRPPPHYCGEKALGNEMRRVREMQDADVNVPDVIGHGRATLLLSDIGASLSSCLKKASSDQVARDRMVRMAVEAIADVHAKDLYLGNPVPRNMTFDNQCIGFLDFEEDPGEIMASSVAQSRDWLLFVHGVARYYPNQHVELAGLLKVGIDRANPDVRRRVLDAGNRLHKVMAVVWPFGGSAGAIRSALKTLRSLGGAALVFAIAWTSTALNDEGAVWGRNLMGLFA